MTKRSHLEGLESQSVMPVEKFPDCEITIFLGSHHDADDVVELKKKFDLCDIFLPEWSGWGPGMVQAFNALAKGVVVPVDYGRLCVDPPGSKHESVYLNGILSMIYQSKKIIDFSDLPFNHPLLKKINEYYAHETEVDTKVLKSLINDKPAPFLKTVERYQRDELKYHNLVIRQREAYIVRRLPFTLARVISEHPSLPRRPKVLMSLGASHEMCADVIQSHHADVVKTFPVNWNGGFDTYIGTKLRIGRENELPWDTLYLMHLIRRVILSAPGIPSKNFFTLEKIVFEHFNEMTTDEREQFYVSELGGIACNAENGLKFLSVCIDSHNKRLTEK